MSQGSSNPASPSRPVTVSEPQETLTTVSHTCGLSELSASLEALNIKVERKPTVVHRAQTSYCYIVEFWFLAANSLNVHSLLY